MNAISHQATFAYQMKAARDKQSRRSRAAQQLAISAGLTQQQAEQALHAIESGRVSGITAGY